MADREKVINELVEHIESALAVDSDYVDCVRTDLLQTVVGLLKEQKQIKEESITPFEVLDIISSSYGGKQIFFQEENGMIYDRYKCEYITLEDAVYRMAKMVGDYGDA